MHKRKKNANRKINFENKRSIKLNVSFFRKSYHMRQRSQVMIAWWCVGEFVNFEWYEFKLMWPFLQLRQSNLHITLLIDLQFRFHRLNPLKSVRRVDKLSCLRHWDTTQTNCWVKREKLFVEIENAHQTNTRTHPFAHTQTHGERLIESDWKEGTLTSTHCFENLRT